MTETSERMHFSEWRARHMASIAAVKDALTPSATERIRTERSAPEFQSDRERGKQLRDHANDCIGIVRSDADDVVGFTALLAVAAVSISLANAVIDGGGMVTLRADETLGESKPVDRSDALVAIDASIAHIVMVSACLAMELRIAVFRAIRAKTLTINSMRCTFDDVAGVVFVGFDA